MSERYGVCMAGVYLSKDLMAIAGHALKANITTLAPLVLPVSEQLLFFINLVARKVRLLSCYCRTGLVSCPALAISAQAASRAERLRCCLLASTCRVSRTLQDACARCVDAVS